MIKNRLFLVFCYDFACFNAPLAQLVEQLPFKQTVVGSTPTRGTKVSNQKLDLSLIIHNIRSAYNVGAIFRTADGAGVSKIYLTGYTPLPKDQFGRTNKEIHKTALGAEEVVAWEQVKSVASLIIRLKKAGREILALEQAENSIDYRKVKIKFPATLLLGEEVRGVTKDLLKKCDQIIEIPMRGQKESLNVSVATGIAIYQILQ